MRQTLGAWGGDRGEGCKGTFRITLSCPVVPFSWRWGREVQPLTKYWWFVLETGDC